MHTVDLYEAVKTTAEALGYLVREEDLGGLDGGVCHVAGRKCIFVNLRLSPIEQLDQLSRSLAVDPAIHIVDLIPEVRTTLGLARAA